LRRAFEAKRGEEQMISESNWDAQQYLESVEYPLSKEDLVSDAESKGAPQDFTQQLEGLAERESEYNGPSEVLEALAYEEQETQRRGS
jgi:hypothetical protein